MGLLFSNVILSLYFILWSIFVAVPTPSVNVTTLSTQTVGQSLTLQCEVITMRGITSRVDIVWSSDDTVLRKINDTTATTMNNSLVYTDSYTISQLNTTDDGRVIQCEVVINTSPSVMASDSITLDVTGECGILISSRILTLYIPMQWNDP